MAKGTQKHHSHDLACLLLAISKTADKTNLRGDHRRKIGDASFLWLLALLPKSEGFTRLDASRMFGKPKMQTVGLLETLYKCGYLSKRMPDVLTSPNEAISYSFTLFGHDACQRILGYYHYLKSKDY